MRSGHRNLKGGRRLPFGPIRGVMPVSTMTYKLLKSSFLGSELPTDRHVHIIGGGIAGLLTGFYLKKAGVPFTIYEKGERCGGLLGSHTHQYGRSEQAANGFLWCPEIQEVCDDLKLPVLGPKDSAKARYLVRRGRLRKMPLSPWELTGAMVRAAMPHRQEVDTVEEFGQLYFGPVMTRQVLEPAFAGIYGADIRNLSFPGALTALAQHMHHSKLLPLALWKGRREAKRNAPSFPHKRAGTHSFEGGMGAWVERLQAYLSDHIELGVDGFAKVDKDDKSQRIVLSVPAHVATHFFDEPTLKALLADVVYTPIVTATLFVERSQMSRFKDGFGCLIPRNEGKTILGVLFNSSTFAHRAWDDQTHVSLTCIMRDDTPERRLLKSTDQEVIALVKGELSDLLGLSGDPLESTTYRWPQGIPVYSPGLYKSWFQIDDLLKEHAPHVNLIGNYTGEISIRRMCQEIRKAILGEQPIALLPPAST